MYIYIIHIHCFKLLFHISHNYVSQLNNPMLSIYIYIFQYIYKFIYIYIYVSIYIYISSLSVSFPIGCSGPDFRRERPRTFSEAELSHPMSQTCTWRFTAATMRSVRDRSGAPGPTKATPLKGGGMMLTRNGGNVPGKMMKNQKCWIFRSGKLVYIFIIYMEMWLEYSLEYMFLDMSRKHPSNIDPYGIHGFHGYRIPLNIDMIFAMVDFPSSMSDCEIFMEAIFQNTCSFGGTWRKGTDIYVYI